jgi:hypothetical protein
MAVVAKILLSFVGMRDPYNIKGGVETEGSILSICAEITPDIVYLFPSSKDFVTPLSDGRISSTDDKALEVERIYKGVSPDCEFRIRSLEVGDVTDFEELSVEFESKIVGVISDLGGRDELKNHEFHLNCSSGTQQMTALGYIMANTGRIPQIRRWQIKDPDFNSGLLPRVREIITDVIEENNCIEKIKGNLDKLNYYSIKDECERLSAVACSQRRRDNVSVLAQIFDAYINLDLLNYQRARGLLNLVLENPAISAAALDIIREQNEFLRLILNTGGNIADESSQNLVDLYFNMERCLSRGAYADVLARFRRVLEGSVYFMLRTTFGLEPRDIQSSKNSANLAILQGNHNFGSFVGHVPFHKAFKAMEILDDYYNGVKGYKFHEYKKFFIAIEKEIDRLVKIRNNSGAAHGMRPVSYEDARDGIPLARDVLTTLIPNTVELLENYPFTPEKIMNLVDILLA